MTKIKHIGHIVLYVADPARSAQWYCDLLGMEVVTVSTRFGAYFLSFGQRDHDIALMKAPENTELGQTDFHHLAFQIDGDLQDFKAFQAKLIDQGTTINGTVDHGFSYGIYFLDPDGHQLEVFLQRMASDDVAKQEMHKIGAIAEPIVLEDIEA